MIETNGVEIPSLYTIDGKQKHNNTSEYLAGSRSLELLADAKKMSDASCCDTMRYS